jgi:hypothetical protein
VQLLYLDREVSGTGLLKGIAWKPPAYTSSLGATYTNLTVSVASHPLNALTGTFVTGLVPVRTGGDYTVPAGETGFIPIPLDQPASFLYDGTEHLLIEITLDGGTALNPVDGQDIAPARRLLWSPSPTAVAGTVETWAVSLRLEFE